MNINLKAFTISFTLVVSIFSLILFIWCAINGFGAQLVQIFESIHPSGGFSIIENYNGSFLYITAGIAINTAYTILDTFIASFIFAFTYNKINNINSKKIKK